MRILIACAKQWFFESEKTAEFLGLDTVWVSNPKELNEQLLNGLEPRFIFFPHWNWKVSKEVYENYLCVVFHIAPLPFGRGGSPIQNLILRGFKEAPLNALIMDADLDAGDILLREVISLDGKLSEILSRAAVVIQKQIVQITKEDLNPMPQSGKFTTFRRLSDEDNQICLENMTLAKVYDHIRMLDAPDYPKAFLEAAGFRLEFSDAVMSETSIDAKVKISKRNT